jgi:hypothetical protein
VMQDMRKQSTNIPQSWKCTSSVSRTNILDRRCRGHRSAKRELCDEINAKSAAAKAAP